VVLDHPLTAALVGPGREDLVHDEQEVDDRHEEDVNEEAVDLQVLLEKKTKMPKSSNIIGMQGSEEKLNFTHY